MYRRAPEGMALVRHGVGGTTVILEGGWVIPGLHRVEGIDLEPPPIILRRIGKEGLRCRDGIRADLVMTFELGIDPDPGRILEVERTLGARHAVDPDRLLQRFEARFLEALKTVARAREFDEIEADPAAFEKAAREFIGDDLGGYSLRALAIDSLSETPIEFLDPGDLIDAEGIKKLTEREMRQQKERSAIERERAKQAAIERANREGEG